MRDRYTVGATEEFAASLDRAWEAMTDFGRYGEWNTFLPRVDVLGPPAPPGRGTRLKLYVVFADGSTSSAAELVTVWQPPTDGRAELTYDFGGPLHALGLVRATRTQVLEDLGDGRVRYTTSESFRGLARPFLPLDKIAIGMRTQAAALGRRVAALG